MLRSPRVRRTSEKLLKRRIHILGLVIFYVLGTVIVRKFYNSQVGDQLEEEETKHGPSFRKLLSVTNNYGNKTNGNTTIPCTKPSIDEFPRDVFTQNQRRYGAVLCHVFLALYMFIALAFVCDDYFISSLDKICEHLDLSEDVAGATFMAAGSSAPELFTAIIGVFIVKGDVGLGTVVGSAVFNILVIIALCALFAGQIVHLSWWPLCRDASYYILAIGALIWTLYDGRVAWYESMTMILMYFGYILLMKFNPMIVHRLNKRRQMQQAIAERVNLDSDSKLIIDNDQISVKYMENGKSQDFGDDERGLEQLKMADRKRITWKELGLMIMLTDKFSPTTRFRAACLIVIHREDHKKMLKDKSVASEKGNDIVNEISTSPNREMADNSKEESDDIEGTPFLYPDGSPIRAMFWVLSLPLVFLMYFTIPDCRKRRWENWWLATFFFSIFWIMIFSYVMVWMVCVIGYTIGVPDVIMGITFLAAGTSIPDAISSLLVAREGMGDMAVSNSIGSNIFDILIGLALPWFIKCAIINPGANVEINSRGMVYSVALLFASVILTVLLIRCNKWCLDRKLGIIFTFIYLGFVTLSACIEFNLFAFVNFPTCIYE